jgi:hypothetical protein
MRKIFILAVLGLALASGGVVIRTLDAEPALARGASLGPANPFPISSTSL